MKLHRNKGFTIIELLIVVAVIGVLAAIAYPSFVDSMKKARRADAMDAITSIRLAQEKFRANCREFAQGFNDNTATCDNADPTNNVIRHSATSLGGYYTLALSGADGTSYVIKATPTSKGNQDEDECGYFELKINKTDAGGVVQAVQKLTESGDADLCWRR